MTPIRRPIRALRSYSPVPNSSPGADECGEPTAVSPGNRPAIVRRGCFPAGVRGVDRDQVLDRAASSAGRVTKRSRGNLPPRHWLELVTRGQSEVPTAAGGSVPIVASAAQHSSTAAVSK